MRGWHSTGSEGVSEIAVRRSLWTQNSRSLQSAYRRIRVSPSLLGYHFGGEQAEPPTRGWRRPGESRQGQTATREGWCGEQRRPSLWLLARACGARVANACTSLPGASQPVVLARGSGRDIDVALPTNDVGALATIVELSGSRRRPIRRADARTRASTLGVIRWAAKLGPERASRSTHRLAQRSKFGSSPSVWPSTSLRQRASPAKRPLPRCRETTRSRCWLSR